MNLKFYALISVLLFSTVMTPIVAHAENDLVILLEEEDDDYIEKLLAYLVSQGKSMDSLKAEFLRDESIEKPNSVLAKNKSKIVKLEKRMGKLAREFKRAKIKIVVERPQRPRKFNRFFFGDPNLAVDATQDEIHLYKDVLAHLERLIKEQEAKFPGLKTGHLSTFQDCLELIGDLFHYHTHNHEIGLEAYWTGESLTYYNIARNRAAIHWDKTGDANPYELRATLIYTIFERAYQLALENSMLLDMFNFLSKSAGCLEARINRLNDWWIEKSAILARRRHSDGAPVSQKADLSNLLEESAERTVFRYIEELGEAITGLVERDGKEGLAQQIVKTFENRVDETGNGITVKLVRQCLSISLLTPVSTPEHHAIEPVRPSRESLSRKRLSFEEDTPSNPEIEQIENLAAQVAGIRRIELPNGEVAFNAHMIRIAANGNCGMTAVGTDRVTFIREVVSAYLDPNSSIELRQYIDQAIADLHLQPGDIQGWARAFNSPGQWIEDFHFEIFARIHHQRIEVFGVDQQNLTFYHLRTFGLTEEGEPIRIINRALLPTHHEEARPLNGNHFDRLVLTDAPQPGFPLINLEELPGVTAVVGALTLGFASMTLTKMAKK